MSILLAVTKNCLIQLVGSKYLDPSKMARDCLETFCEYEWAPSGDLDELQLSRWSELL
jgi:hypothetical protein